MQTHINIPYFVLMTPIQLAICVMCFFVGSRTGWVARGITLRGRQVLTNRVKQLTEQVSRLKVALSAGIYAGREDRSWTPKQTFNFDNWVTMSHHLIDNDNH